MNHEIQGRWSEIRNIIQTKWGKFSSSELESFRNNLDGVVSRLEKVYGHTRGRAEREYHEFRQSLRVVLLPVERRR